MSRRPRLRAHLRPVRIGPGLVQLGSDPEDSFLLDGLSDAEAELLFLLDGRVELGHATRSPGHLRVAPERIAELIGVLDALDALLDTPAASERRVTVSGDPSLARRLSDVLLGCGVPVATAGRPDLEVIAGPLGVPALAHPGRATLPVQMGARRLVIGPLVPALQGPDDPCPSCLPVTGGAWPAAAATPPAQVSLAAGALVAAHVLAYLDGDPLPVATTHELELATLDVVRRVWPRDPRCPGCGPVGTGAVSVSA